MVVIGIGDHQDLVIDHNQDLHLVQHSPSRPHDHTMDKTTCIGRASKKKIDAMIYALNQLRIFAED